MKRQIAFYIGWDVVFIGSMYVFSKCGRMLELAARKQMEVGASLWFPVVWMIVTGGLIGVLVIWGSKYQKNIKSAILELVITGLPAVYIAGILPFSYSLASLSPDGGVSYYIPFWLLMSTTPMLAAGILLGYEIFIFAVRLFTKPHRLRPSENDYSC